MSMQILSTNLPSAPVPARRQLPVRLIGRLIVPGLLVDGMMKLAPWPLVIEAMDWIGYGSSDALARASGAITTACAALTTIPPSSIVGAILWTGYLGNFVATHLSIV